MWWKNFSEGNIGWWHTRLSCCWKDLKSQSWGKWGRGRKLKKKDLGVNVEAKRISVAESCPLGPLDIAGGRIAGGRIAMWDKESSGNKWQHHKGSQKFQQLERVKVLEGRVSLCVLVCPQFMCSWIQAGVQTKFWQVVCCFQLNVSKCPLQAAGMFQLLVCSIPQALTQGEHVIIKHICSSSKSTDFYWNTVCYVWKRPKVNVPLQWEKRNGTFLLR